MKTYAAGRTEEERGLTKEEEAATEEVMAYIESYSEEEKQAMMNEWREMIGLEPEAKEENKSVGDSASVHAKSEISQPGDPSELQADKVAEAVGKGDQSSSKMTMDEKVSDVAPKGGNASRNTNPEFEAQLQSSKGQGTALDENVKGEMEGHLGADLSGVKIHTGENANAMSENINAKAFTHGQDVYFKDGNYDPASTEGKQLLAHELAHTRQQKGEGLGRMIQRKKDPDPGLGATEYTLSYTLFKVPTPVGGFEGSIKLILEKDSPLIIGSKDDTADKEDKQTINLFKGNYETKNTNDVINSTVGATLANYETGDLELFNGLAQVTFEFDALSAELEKEEIEISLLKVEGKVFGAIEKPEQLIGTPWDSEMTRKLMARGFVLKFGGSITYSIEDPREIARLIKMKRYERQLAKIADQIKVKTKELIELKKQKHAAWKESMAKFREKHGIPENTRYSEFTKKQKKKFKKFLKKNDLYKKLGKKINAVKNSIRKLNKLAKPIMSKMVNLAKAMKTPLGKIAGKLGLKAAAKLLARLNLALDVILLIADIITFIRFYEHIKPGMGETPNPWDDVPDEVAEEGADGGDGNGESTVAAEKENTNTERSAGESENEGDGFEEFENEEEAVEEPDGSAEKSEAEEEMEAGNIKGAASKEQGLPQEVIDNMMQVADEGQKTIYNELTSQMDGIAFSEKFLENYIALPLSGLEGKQLQTYIARMRAGVGPGLKTEEEILTALENLLDDMDLENINAAQSEQKVKDEQEEKEMEASIEATEFKNQQTILKDKGDGGGFENKNGNKEANLKESDFLATAKPTTAPPNNPCTDVATSLILLKTNVNAGETKVPAKVNGTILTTGETFEVDGLLVNIISVSSKGLIVFEMADDFEFRINAAGRKLYYTKGSRGSKYKK